jgi:hypothetical protein
MIAYVQNAVTRLYLSSNFTWTTKMDQACAFENSLSAIDFCVAAGLRNVEILLKVPHSFDVRIPLSAGWLLEQNQCAEATSFCA